MSFDQDVDAVLRSYAAAELPADTWFLGGGGGFSGALFWRVQAGDRLLCLRRWPRQYPAVDELSLIHSVLEHSRSRGFQIAAVPQKNHSGETYVRRSGHLWEVGPWMPGEPRSTEDVTNVQLAAAMRCLAEFHRSTEDYGLANGKFDPSGPSKAVAQRSQVLEDWISGRATQLQQAVCRSLTWPEMRERTQRLLGVLPDRAPPVAELLAQARTHHVSLQPCIRDIWSDHVLFSESKVTGLIDFGSMGIDNVSCDVARLLGSYARDSADLWRLGIEAYTRVRDLSQAEIHLVRTLDHSGVLLGALNWAAWVFLEERVFDDRTAVLARMDALLARLESESSPPPDRGLLL